MTLTHEFETLFFILFASVICLVSMAILRNNPFHNVRVVAPLPNFNQTSPTLSPSPTAVVAKTTTTSWESSDGTMKATLITTANPNLSTTYTATVTDSNGNTTTLLTQTITGMSTMSIPFNAFSSSDTYVFFKQTVGSNVHFLVFKSSEQPFANGENFLDIVPAFTAYTSTYTLSDVTGWAADTLLVVNTKKADGTGGPSYWYDVESHSFIPLATVFE